jgi:hypothetical protein
MSTSTPQVRHPSARLVGLAALAFSALYFASDVIELAQGGFSTPQLLLTYVAEAAIPVFVLGLYAVQRPHIGTLGLLGAIGYSYAFIFFSGTVLLALVNRPPDWDALVGDLGPWVAVHGLLMVGAGSAFGIAVLKARVLPPWTGMTLVTGVILVALSSALPSLAQTISAGVRDLGFAGMGLFLLTRPASNHVSLRRPRERTESTPTHTATQDTHVFTSSATARSVVHVHP